MFSWIPFFGSTGKNSDSHLTSTHMREKIVFTLEKQFRNFITINIFLEEVFEMQFQKLKYNTRERWRFIGEKKWDCTGAKFTIPKYLTACELVQAESNQGTEDSGRNFDLSLNFLKEFPQKAYSQNIAIIRDVYKEYGPGVVGAAEQGLEIRVRSTQGLEIRDLSLSHFFFFIMTQQTVIYQRFSFSSWYELPSSFWKLQTTTPKTSLVFNWRLSYWTKFMCSMNEPNKLNCYSLKQRKFYCRVKQREQVACVQKLQDSWYFGGRNFYSQNLGWWWWDLWLPSDWLLVGNRVVILLCIFLEEEPGLCLNTALFFLVFPSLISASPSFPGYRLFEYALWNSEKVKEAKWSLFPTKKKK